MTNPIPAAGTPEHAAYWKREMVKVNAVMEASADEILGAFVAATAAPERTADEMAADLAARIAGDERLARIAARRAAR